MSSEETDLVEYESPLIHKKDMRNIENIIGSVKELLTIRAEQKIKEYLKKYNITEYNNEPFRESDKYVEST